MTNCLAMEIYAIFKSFQWGLGKSELHDFFFLHSFTFLVKKRWKSEWLVYNMTFSSSSQQKQQMSLESNSRPPRPFKRLLEVPHWWHLLWIPSDYTTLWKSAAVQSKNVVGMLWSHQLQDYREPPFCIKAWPTQWLRLSDWLLHEIIWLDLSFIQLKPCTQQGTSLCAYVCWLCVKHKAKTK